VEPAIGVFVGWFLGEPAPARYVRFAADNRLDPGPLRLDVELDGTEHVAVIGDCQRRHLVLVGQLDYGVEPTGAVKQRILAVRVQMDEIGVLHILQQRVILSVSALP